MRKSKRIDLSEERLARIADKHYNEGDYTSALRFAYSQYDQFGPGDEVFARLADIYEGMGLHGSAINWWYRALDIAYREDLPDIYESLAVNYMNIGNEMSSAYYYKHLVEIDPTLPQEAKIEIAQAFAKDKRNNFRVIYPPEQADYAKEIQAGSQALKTGNYDYAIKILSSVPCGSRDYAEAMEMRAVSNLLKGDTDEAERVCKALLETVPDDTRTLATLSAVYLEQGRTEESKEIALRLNALDLTETDEIYKVATVCCENGLHKEAYEKFCLLEPKMNYDGRMLYFKAVSAFKSGLLKEAKASLTLLCDIYPDAEVAKFYLRSLRQWEDTGTAPIEPTYFYHLPQEEREERASMLVQMSKAPKDEVELFGMLALHDGFFRWCFDEMDGGDHDLQYLALICAERARADEFLSEVLLDHEVLDILKIETLRMLYERNEETTWGMVFYNMYRKVHILSVSVGRKKRKVFINGHARLASKFTLVNEGYGAKLKTAIERLYKVLEAAGLLDLATNDTDVACTAFFVAGLKELGGDRKEILEAFEANAENVDKMIVAYEGNYEERKDEAD